MTTAKVLEIIEYYQEKFIKDQKVFDKKVIEDLIAADVMTPHVVTISSKATVRDAVDLFLEEKVTALAVVNHRNSAIGVFSETDLARFERERPSPVLDAAEQEQLEALNSHAEHMNHFHVESFTNHAIADWMTPLVISVNTTDSLKDVCTTLARHHIHRVFVKDKTELVGVISSMDIVSAMASVFEQEK